MKEPKSDRVMAVALSVLLHGGLIAVLVYGWWTFHQESKPVPTLALDATVVDGKSLGRAQSRRPPEPEPPPPSPPPTPPPPDTAAQQAAAEAEKRAEAEKHAAEQRAAEEKEEKRVAEQKEAERQHEEAEQKAQAEAERRAQEEAERKAEEAKRKEQQRLAEAKRLADEKRKADEAKRQAEDAADLQKSLANEEHLMAARSGGAMANWQAQIAARIKRAWIQPPSARPGIDCVVHVTQVPGGEVVSVKVGACNGDEAVRESIEAAAYRASPLPPPPDPALFERDLEIRFKPE